MTLPSSPLPPCAAVVVAAGRSRRMGFDKVLAELCGRPLFAHSLLAFARCEFIGRIVVVGAQDRLSALREAAACLPGNECGERYCFVTGGAERVESVLNGLAALEGFEGFVAIHDAARPLISPEAIGMCFGAAIEEGAAACAEPLVDTIHQVDAAGFATRPLDREGIWRMQTPQIFRRHEILAALRQAVQTGKNFTDDVAAMLAMGGRVRLVEPPHPNFKITVRRDFELASLLLAARLRDSQ